MILKIIFVGNYADSAFQARCRAVYPVRVEFFLWLKTAAAQHASRLWLVAGESDPGLFLIPGGRFDAAAGLYRGLAVPGGFG